MEDVVNVIRNGLNIQLALKLAVLVWMTQPGEDINKLIIYSSMAILAYLFLTGSIQNLYESIRANFERVLERRGMSSSRARNTQNNDSQYQDSTSNQQDRNTTRSLLIRYLHMIPTPGSDSFVGKCYTWWRNLCRGEIPQASGILYDVTIFFSAIFLSLLPPWYPHAPIPVNNLE